MDWAYVGTLAIMFEPSGFLFFWGECRISFDFVLSEPRRFSSKNVGTTTGVDFRSAENEFSLKPFREV